MVNHNQSGAVGSFEWLGLNHRPKTQVTLTTVDVSPKDRYARESTFVADSLFYEPKFLPTPSTAAPIEIELPPFPQTLVPVRLFERRFPSHPSQSLEPIAFEKGQLIVGEFQEVPPAEANRMPVLECSPSNHREGITYTENLTALNQPYPGLVDRLKGAETWAWIVSFAGTTGQYTRKVLADPPWPLTDFGSSRKNIQTKALEIQRNSPRLASAEIADYDFPLAQTRARELQDELMQLFPLSDFPGARCATRAKTPQSLEAKLHKRREAGEFSLAHITDTVGGRLDCVGLKMLGSAARQFEEHYGGRIVAKKDCLSKPGELGYRALHYVVDLGDRMAEIQLCTHDLRATDLATHDTLYKPHFELDKNAAALLRNSADRIMEAECFRLCLEGR